ncbi:MAG: hypothetical protein HY814_02605 [Candidatus Riflebacteria bacterium]|nr:hypothetical protein [Candidatus Riflebacteria bacterium]
MKKWIKRLAVVAILLGLVAGAGVLAVRHFVNPEAVLGHLRQALGPGFQGKLELEEVLIEPPDILALRGFKCTLNSMPDRPLVQVKEIVCSFDYTRLLDGEIRIVWIALNSAEVNLQRTADGKLNLLELGALGRHAAAPVPALPRKMLATAAVTPRKGPSVDKVLLEDGRLTIDDKISAQQAEITSVSGQIILNPAVIVIPSVSGQLLRTIPVSVDGQVMLTPKPAARLGIHCDGLALSTIQSRIPMLAGARAMGFTADGQLSGHLEARIEPPASEVGGALTVKSMSLQDPFVTRNRLNVPDGVAKVTVKVEPGQPLSAMVDASFPRVNVTPLAGGVPVEGQDVVIGCDYRNNNLALRVLQMHLFGGDIELKGTVAGLGAYRLEVQAARVPAGQLLAQSAFLQNRPWANGLFLQSYSGTVSPGEITFNPVSLMVQGDSSVTANGSLRASGLGYELASVSGNAELSASLLGQVTGFFSPTRLNGRLSVRCTGDTTGFSAELRSQELNLTDQRPEIRFKGVAAAVRGVRSVRDGQSMVAWSANIRSSVFTLVWPELLRAIGIPIEGPVVMTNGDAQVFSDAQGLHVLHIKANSAKLSLSSERIDVSPGGDLSGDLQAEIFSEPSKLLRPPIVATLGGTLAAPTATVR